MRLRSAELSRKNSSKAPTWCVSCRCFTTDSLPRGYPGQLFGLRRIAKFGGYAKRLTIYTGSGPRLGRVITLRPVLALAYLRCIALSIGYAFSSQWVPSPALYSPGAERRCLCPIRIQGQSPKLRFGRLFLYSLSWSFGFARCFAPRSSWRLGCRPCYQGLPPYSMAYGGPIGFPIDKPPSIS